MYIRNLLSIGTLALIAGCSVPESNYLQPKLSIPTTLNSKIASPSFFNVETSHSPSASGPTSAATTNNSSATVADPSSVTATSSAAADASYATVDADASAASTAAAAGGASVAMQRKIFFNDAYLNELIDTAINSNRELKSAVLKLKEAQAQHELVDADRYPSLSTSSAISYNGSNADHSTKSDYNTALDSRFELDFFSKLSSMSEAQQQRFLASAAAQRSVHILLVSNVAQSYYKLILSAEQLSLAKKTLDNYRLSYALAEKTYAAGSGSLRDLESAKGQIESMYTQIAKREGEVALASNALALLLSDYNTNFMSKLPSSSSIEPLHIEQGLSSTVLLSRPDIMEAEFLLKASEADVEAARAAFFPSIALTGSWSSQSQELSELFDPVTLMWSFIPKIELPLFNGGKNKANLNIAQLRQHQAVLNYEQKIQVAFRETSDALASRDAIEKQIAAQDKYLTSLHRTLALTKDLYSTGAVSYAEVLSAELLLFATEQSLLDLKYELIANEIKLFTALGGGLNP